MNGCYIYLFKIWRNFPVLIDSLTSNFEISAEHSDEIFETFGFVLKVVAFLLLTKLFLLVYQPVSRYWKWAYLFSFSSGIQADILKEIKFINNKKATNFNKLYS